ncbi:MAG: S8 family serine peptidase [Anaerolineae bacterium]|nr:S8 family serine peptidase [Caldilineales bacterium]MCX7851880.1 S8 family serine peptidase [Caldilineales bacterium]MDW8268692.1 S8 family serine peptidase [Anaerolineae bacterium]
MRSYWLMLFLLGLLLTALIPPGNVLGGSRRGFAVDPLVPHATDHILVKMRPGAGAPAGAQKHLFGAWYAVAVGADETPVTALTRWAARPDVALVELDYRVGIEPTESVAAAAPQSGMTRAAFVPNDPLYGEQWNLPLIRAPEAWEQANGAGVTVAVVDSGVSPGDDLACVTFVDEFNALTGRSGPGAARDENGHGTHVAGTIAQCTNNGIGVAGVAPAVHLMPIRVLDAAGFGSFAAVAQGVEWARNHGAAVINLSLGMACSTQTWPQCSSSILNEALAAAAAADIVIVAAAGNFNQGVLAFPGNHPEVIGVGAVDQDLARAPYSNRGQALDLSAPGGNLQRDGDGDGHPDHIAILQQTIVGSSWQYQHKQGTSMAAAHVSGAVALLRGYVPGATRGQIRAALQETARDLGPSGFDTNFGHGLIQIDAALRRLEAMVMAPTPTATLTEMPTATMTPTATPTETPNPPATPPVTSLWLPLLRRGEGW